MNNTQNETISKDIIIFKKISNVDKYNFYEYLSVMIDAWVWIAGALESVTDKISNPYFIQRIKELLVFISSGDSLSKAMKKDPNAFSQHEVSIIEAWEATGTLSTSLLNIANNLNKRDELQKKIKWALTYPIIIFLFLLVAIIVVLTYVIPAIMPLFENAEAQLPTATKALIATSDFVSHNFLVILLFIFTIFVFFVGYKSTKSWKERLDNLLLGLPLVGKIYRNYILANISSSLGNLIWAWVPTLKALKLVGKSSGSYVYEKIFELVTRRVEVWEKIVDSMKEVDEDGFYFPPAFLQMLSVWEKTANIEEISLKIYNQYNREVEYSLSNLTKWIEPLAILLASWFVIWFAFAIFGAIMKITDVIS